MVPPVVIGRCRLRMYLTMSSQPLGFRLLLLHHVARILTNSSERVSAVLYRGGPSANPPQVLQITSCTCD